MTDHIKQSNSAQYHFSFSLLAGLEKEHQDSVYFKRMYVSLCDDDLVAGILLSNIIYWFHNGKDGDIRAKCLYQDRRCIVRQRKDWWDICCISEKQYDRAIKIIKELGFVDVETHKSPFHNSETAAFIFINEDKLMSAVIAYLMRQSGNLELPKGEFRNSPNGDSRIDKRGTPYISITTTENTSKNTNTPPNPQRGRESGILISFGKFVKLKQEEYDAFIKDRGKRYIDDMIDEMNDYCSANKPAGYKDYAAALRNWIRDRDRKTTTNKHTNKKESDYQSFEKDLSNDVQARKAKGGVPISWAIYQAKKLKSHDLRWYVITRQDGTVWHTEEDGA